MIQGNKKKPAAVVRWAEHRSHERERAERMIKDKKKYMYKRPVL
jgi:F420-0:gamma-glutamyl ligase